MCRARLAFHYSVCRSSLTRRAIDENKGRAMFNPSEIGRLRSRLRRYLARYLRRPEDVEDIAQESFLRVLDAAAKGEIHYPRSYLYRTARNLAFNTRARKSNQLDCSLEDSELQDVLVDNRAGPEARVMAQRHFESFCRAVTLLPPQCRQVLLLRKVQGLSQREVAERLGISVSTVEKHLAKALLRCRQYLDTVEDTDDEHSTEADVKVKASRQ